MRLIIKETPQDCANWTADYIANKINSYNPTPDNPFVLGLPTGSSPLPTYKRLIELYKNGKVSFANVVTFNMDEYINLPPEHPQSYHYFMQEKLFFKHGELLNFDFQSFGPTRQWFDHEWGSSLVFYQILDKFGDFWPDCF